MKINIFIIMFIISATFLFSEKVAIVYDGPLRIRNDSTIESPIIGRLETHEKVKIIDQAKEIVQIDEINDYWYKIYNRKGTVGWVFGGYLAIYDIDDYQSYESILFSDRIFPYFIQYLMKYNYLDNRYRNLIIGGSISINYYENKNFFLNMDNIENDFTDIVLYIENYILLLLCKRITNESYLIIDVAYILKPNENSFLIHSPYRLNNKEIKDDLWIFVTEPFANTTKDQKIITVFRSDINAKVIKQIEVNDSIYQSD